MRKSSQRKLRQSWMRKYRLAMKGQRYLLHRMPRVSIYDSEGRVVDSHLGKLYILKNDGRRVMQITRKNGRIDNVIVMSNPVGVVHE